MVAKLTLLMDLARYPQDLNLDLNLDLMAVRLQPVALKHILLMVLAHKQPGLKLDLPVARKSMVVRLLLVVLKLIPLTPLTDLAHNQQLDLNLGLKLLLEVKLLLLARKPMEVTLKLILLMGRARNQQGLNLDLPVALKLLAALKLILLMDLDLNLQPVILKLTLLTDLAHK